MPNKHLKNLVAFIKSSIPLPGEEKNIPNIDPEKNTGENDTGTGAREQPTQKPWSLKDTLPPQFKLFDETKLKSPSYNTTNTSSNQNVINMQAEMIALYNDFKSNKAFEGLYGYPNSTQGQEKGSDYFLHFLLNRYVKKSDIHGQQNATDVKETKDIKGDNLADKANNPLDFKKLLETLQTVGTHTQEGYTKPDGLWGKNTNNGLKNTYAFAYAIVNIEKNMKLNISGYSDKELSELQSNIPPDYTKIDDTDGKAITITKNLGKLRVAIKSFISEMLNEGSKFGEYTNNQKAFEAGYTKQSTENFLTTKEKENLKTLSNPPSGTQSITNVPGVNTSKDINNTASEQVLLNFNNISDINKFKKYLQDNEISIGREHAWKDNDSVVKVINTLIKSVWLRIQQNKAGA